MKFTAKRLLAAGAIGISAIVTPLSLTAALSGVGGAPSSVAGASAFDQIFFNQTSGSPADTFQYAPASGPASPLQAVNVSGNCATPTGGGAAILSVCGKLYSSTNYIGGTTKAASLGTNGPATGVGAITPSWTVDNKSNKGAEAIDFAPGSDTAVIGSNRAFIDAQIPVQRKDSGVAQPGLTVQLAEFDSSGTLLGTQNCPINGGQGAQITADPDTCTVSMPAAGGGFPAQFQTIEVRDLTSSTSISVVGPTSTFELGNVICGGQAINPANNGGNVTATLTLTGAAGQCKSYTSFSDSIDPQSGLATLDFNGFSTSNVQITVQITWPAVPLCNPYVDTPGSPAPGGTTGIPNEPGLAQNMCPVHQFQLNGTPFFDQAYCQNAQAPGSGIVPQQELCTVAKSYNNDTISLTNSTGAGTACPAPAPPCIPVTTPITLSDGTTPGTQITETWVGFVDMHFH